VCVDCAVRTESLYIIQVSSDIEMANIGEGLFGASGILCWAEQHRRLIDLSPRIPGIMVGKVALLVSST
jgi:hypothetical protein